MSSPLHVVLLPRQLGVRLVELVHDQVDLRRRHVVGQDAVLPSQQGLQHVGEGLQNQRAGREQLLKVTHLKCGDLLRRNSDIKWLN